MNQVFTPNRARKITIGLGLFMTLFILHFLFSMRILGTAIGISAGATWVFYTMIISTLTITPEAVLVKRGFRTKVYPIATTTFIFEDEKNMFTLGKVVQHSAGGRQQGKEILASAVNLPNFGDLEQLIRSKIRTIAQEESLPAA